VKSSRGFLRDALSARERAEAERERLLTSEEITREEAEAANRHKDQFLAVLSHELRTNAIKFTPADRRITVGLTGNGLTRRSMFRTRDAVYRENFSRTFLTDSARQIMGVRGSTGGLGWD
jgi:signal transduction histidine kinase